MARADAVATPGDSPEERLRQIADLLSYRGRMTPGLLRTKIWAICEGRALPTRRHEFALLAMRAGVPTSGAYRAWKEAYGTHAERDSGTADVIRISRARDERPSAWVVPPAPSRITALYRYYDEQDRLLYVGISDGLSGRVADHVDGSSWMDFAVRSTIVRYPVRAEAALAEIEAIKAEHPLFNQKHNHSPEARRRLVEYLVEHDRLDLLAPAVSRG